MPERLQGAAARLSPLIAPLAVFVGFGAIDVCFKLVAQAGAPFTSALLASFLIAMGVVVLGALVGAFGFKERLAEINWLGVALAIGAIAVMTSA